MSELANLIAEMGRASERGNPSYLRVISSRLFSGEKWQRMMELAQAAVVEPPRRKLARKLAVITPLTVSDVLIDLQHLTDDEAERFLAPGANIEQALDLATLRRVAPGIDRRYPSLQLFPLPDGRPIPNGAHRSVRGSKGFYTVCNHGGQLFCDCPSFAFSKEPQSCKHVRGLEPAQYGKKG